MKLSLVVAMDKNRVIGVDGGLPWHLSSDLKYFRDITMGKPIIMGRKTHESIGRPLPGRRNIVVSRNPDFEATGCDVVESIEAALTLVEDVPEAMMIGGASLYVDTLAFADQLYLTEVHAEVEGDTLFPELDLTEWKEISRSAFSADGKNDHDYSFVVYKKRKKRFERVVGLNVTDEQSYQQYRDAMMPILISMGGKFTYDFRVGEVLKSESENTINRLFIISFPDEKTHDKFFDLAEYKAIKEKYFKPAVESVSLISKHKAKK
ncbi:MAG: dihydrofolate reductase [Gammaproteobacteria bacterium]